MKDPRKTQLSPIEREIIGEIRALRMAPRGSVRSSLLKSPVDLLHHFLDTTHGNVQLRIGPIAQELGMGMRTLERAFARKHGVTVTEHQITARLSYSRWMLSILPQSKTSAIASVLGYTRVQAFHRFFKKHMGESPAEWGRRERERIANAARNPPAV